MNRKRAMVVLVAPPGPVRDGLTALFTAIASLRLGAEIGDLESARRHLRAAPPDVIVLDGALAGPGLEQELATLRLAAPDSAWLVLVDDMEQYASTAVTERVLVKGTPPSELVAAVEVLLASSRSDAAQGS